MEVKKRYYFNGLFDGIYDSKIDDYPSNETICTILNQQDKLIKLLEESNRLANINNYLADYLVVVEENRKLKQQLYDFKNGKGL